MIGSRLKKLVIVAGAGAVATASTLALNPFSASAADTATTTTVTAPASEATTGHAVMFTAKVSPSKTTSAPVTRATGTVTFTVVGRDSSTVSCVGTNPAALTSTGRAFCKVAADTLTAASSPYTVTAAYSGGNGFGASTGTLSETVNLAPTTVKVTNVTGTPSSDTASSFTATVTGGNGLPTGTVTFTVFADKPSKKKDWRCALGNTQTLTSSDGTPPVATATCALKAGWLIVANASKSDPKPESQWSVTAQYNGSNAYEGSNGTKHGTATS